MTLRGAAETGKAADGDASQTTPVPASGLAVPAPVSDLQGIAPELPEGLVSGRYRIRSYLNQGATSHVYLADDLEAETSVVLKVLKTEAAGRPELRQCIERETRAAGALRHPNIVRVLSGGETAEGLPYVVMEAEEAEPLDSVLRRCGKVAPELVLLVARQAGAALAAAHAAGIVHRDVKPGNLLVLGAAEAPRGIKLLDFGMAKLADEEEDPEASTVLGTVEYMAPEQIVVESVDARADIYALGVLLFRLATGHLPFDTEAGPIVLRHQLFSPLPPPSWLDEQIDPRLEAIILNATRKHPDNRYPSMEALLEDLAALLEDSDRPVTTRTLCRVPDAYEPRTERGREALEILSRKFGPYASVPSALVAPEE
ncbi:MAG TPA: serine/threonine-protein kinase [Polyangiaceae bacterium]|nr:serine/threonine-protein kinase [Polyangiaceae bacterium]